MKSRELEPRRGSPIEHGSDLDEATNRLEAAGKKFAKSQEAKWVKRRKLYNMQFASFQLALKSLYVSVQEKAESTFKIWKWSVDSSDLEKVVDNCGFVTDADPGRQYLLGAVLSGEKTHNVQNETVLRLVLPHCIRMRVSDLTAKQLISVSCPTCGVAPGKRCVLHSGTPRSEPHVDRKLSAAEAIKTKRILPGPGRR